MAGFFLGLQTIDFKFVNKLKNTKLQTPCYGCRSVQCNVNMKMFQSKLKHSVIVMPNFFFELLFYVLDDKCVIKK